MTICKHCGAKKLCRHTEENLEDCGGFNPIFDPVRQAVQTYGAEAQKWVLIGEIGELLDAIADHKRGRCDVSHVAEEIADVLICLDELMYIYECRGAVGQWKCRKLRRLAANLAMAMEQGAADGGEDSTLSVAADAAPPLPKGEARNPASVITALAFGCADSSLDGESTHSQLPDSCNETKTEES